MRMRNCIIIFVFMFVGDVFVRLRVVYAIEYLLMSFRPVRLFFSGHRATRSPHLSRSLHVDPAGFVPADTHLIQVFFESIDLFQFRCGYSRPPTMSCVVLWHL